MPSISSEGKLTGLSAGTGGKSVTMTPSRTGHIGGHILLFNLLLPGGFSESGAAFIGGAEPGGALAMFTYSPTESKTSYRGRGGGAAGSGESAGTHLVALDSIRPATLAVLAILAFCSRHRPGSPETALDGACERNVDVCGEG